MPQMKPRKTALAALLCSIMLMACTNAERAATEPLRYAPDGKPGSAVSLDYLPATIKVLGGQASVQFSLTPQSSYDRLSVTVTPDDGLGWVPSSQSRQWQGLANQQSVAIDGVVTGLVDGRHYLNVLVSTERGGVQESRSYALPVSVGSGKLLNKSAQSVQTNAEGERLSISQGKEGP